MNDQTRTKITTLLAQNEIVLFMKGSKNQPRCGFSATVVQILEGIGADYRDVDVLSDPALRDGIKEFGNWPTIPQLYYKGSLIGGCDIIRELDQTGELAENLGMTVAPVTAPQIQVSEKAAAAIKDAASQAEPGQGIRIVVKAGGRSHDLVFDNKKPGDLEVAQHGLMFLFDRGSAKLANGLSMDFEDGPDGGGFRIENPNAPAQVRSVTAQELKAKLDQGGEIHLYDVRGPQERAIATIPGAKMLDERAQAEIEKLPKDATLVFHCHHGMRSQQAAEFFIQKGYRNVWNLSGGIDAWSLSVDPTVRRY